MSIRKLENFLIKNSHILANKSPWFQRRHFGKLQLRPIIKTSLTLCCVAYEQVFSPYSLVPVGEGWREIGRTLRLFARLL